MNLTDASSELLRWDRKMCPSINIIPFDIRDTPLGLLKFNLGAGGYHTPELSVIDHCFYSMKFGIL